MISIAQILDGYVEPLNVEKDVHFHLGEHVNKEDLHDQLYASLLVIGENDELTDALGLSWGLPRPSLIYDTPGRSEIWAKHCVEIMKFVVAQSKPRRAIRDATIAMETTLLARGELELCSMDALWGRG